MRLAPALRFQFHPDDHAEYGDGWTIYDESALVRLPARELIDIEREIGMPLITALRRSREQHTDAALAMAWVARRMAGDERPFADFNPLIMLVDWDQVPGGDADPPAPDSSPPPSEE